MPTISPRLAALCLCSTLIATTASAQTPRLEWDPVAGTDIGYVVQYWPNGSSNIATVDVGRTTSWVLPALQPEVTYRFAVQAYDSQRRLSPLSEQITFTLPPLVRGPRTSLLWHHAGTGDLASWTIEGTQQVSGSALRPGRVADTGWKLVTTADFDGDGQRDLLWQYTDGTIAAWIMRGNDLVDGRLFEPSTVNDPDWRVVAAADMNRDGSADLIWRNRRSGTIAVWYMDGTRRIGGVLLSPSTVSDLSWEIVGTGDVNRDGHTDLIWHHRTSGSLSAWMMNGVVLRYGTSFAPNGVSDAEWKVEAVTDITGDGYVDILWRHSDGRIAAWVMSGLTLLRGVPFTPATVADSNWRIVGGR